MTTIELEAKKALLVKEILTDINSEEMIEKLSHYLKRIKGQLMEKENPAPCEYSRPTATRKPLLHSRRS